MPVCKVCDKEKLDVGFVLKRGKPDVRQCKDCRNAAARKWRAEHRAEYRAYHKLRYRRDVTKMRGYQLKHNYGISYADFQNLAEAQEKKCKICLRAAPLCVDHNHKTGEVRGLLCQNCNRALGFFGDDSERIYRAAEYLTKGVPSARGV